MRTIKLVIVGDAGVGKTSLRAQYILGRFLPSYRATIGADFVAKTIPHYSDPSQSVTLQIWDTAGQERFSRLTNAFLRGADAVLLVFDVARPHTLNGLVRWWDEVRAAVPLRSDEDLDALCVVVVGNKLDSVERGRNQEYDLGTQDGEGDGGVNVNVDVDESEDEAGTSGMYAEAEANQHGAVTREEAERFVERLIPRRTDSVRPGAGRDASRLASAPPTFSTSHQSSPPDARTPSHAFSDAVSHETDLKASSTSNIPNGNALEFTAGSRSNSIFYASALKLSRSSSASCATPTVHVSTTSAVSAVPISNASNAMQISYHALNRSAKWHADPFSGPSSLLPPHFRRCSALEREALKSSHSLASVRTTDTMFHTPVSSFVTCSSMGTDMGGFVSAPSSPVPSEVHSPLRRARSFSEAEQAVFHDNVDAEHDGNESVSVSPSSSLLSASTSSAQTITPRLFIRARAASISSTSSLDMHEENDTDAPPPVVHGSGSRSTRTRRRSTLSRPPNTNDIPEFEFEFEQGPKLFLTSAMTGAGVAPVFEHVARRVVQGWERAEAAGPDAGEGFERSGGPRERAGVRGWFGSKMRGRAWGRAASEGSESGTSTIKLGWWDGGTLEGERKVKGCCAT